MANAKAKRTTADTGSAFEIVSRALQGVRGEHRGDSYWICCPFHDENTPSCSVNLSTAKGIPVGHFYCFGCSEGRGPWNKLASKLNLPQLKEWQHYKESAGFKLRANLKVTLDEEEKLRQEIKSHMTIPWPEDKEWRGYKGKLIRKLGGMYFNDSKRDELMLVFPVYINGKLKGGVRAFLKKQEKRASYLTTDGKWVKSAGLFGYDLAKKLIKKHGLHRVVLVEGPRDALRLLSKGIPACAILGTQNFSEKKLMHVLALGVDEILVMPDNDRAGTEMKRLVKEISGDLCVVHHLKLPKEKDKDGKLIKLDPDSAPKEIIREVKKLVYR